MKSFFRYISEITLSIVLIFISYFVWDRIDVEAYEEYITQYTLEDINLSLDENFNMLAYVSEKNNIDNSVLNVHNYQNRNYKVNILLNLNGVTDDLINNLVLYIDGVYLDLNDIIYYNKTNDYCFLITSVDLVEYEKRQFNLKLLVEDEYKLNDISNFSYKIIEEIV